MPPKTTCFKLLKHWMRLALFLAAAKAGSNIAAKMAMMAMTTSNSIRVNPPKRRRRGAGIRDEFDFIPLI